MSEHITYETWSGTAANDITAKLIDELDVLKWAFRTYGNQIVYACSFGAEGMVLLDLISKINKNAHIIFLDTGLHFKETYELIETAKNRYPGFTIQLLEPALSVKDQEKTYGSELWKHNPNLCCHMRKIEPLQKHLSGMDAWISGLRREQSPTRKHVKFINRDQKFKLIKICPLIHWTWNDVWNYIQLNDLPYNKLHDQNYPSIGCEMCTLPSSNPHDERAGRWAGREKTECGLHLE
ncbi:phosphoadenylyl-sulfate reductase [Bacillus atrophaeus]|uniref:phosphoadenylyl-sulfate reductase n=1 Tax=Bacillus atrophaeus TaxID=1452 RepID=UPI002280A875|nr:phosphoadenylyl-sulfate reductase [Bacillus atrophaeus]MCY8838389.1 phosphoadenylyl-sulfate reductase [Bacillus atrophaeus]MEC5219230.1 phosphoadenylyl-sulfate reductase [Bacillus atrophaeus]MED4577400.1 phosphoadenylyl-sulfate reductase [Bacillus atrophaeus]MED4720026.1 phosphoadenylyl-sulfate reductase [Bacillus atrophaeus]MED4801738.1 phosphoadenylyl-sulfate reductase [Bacillus atrophaeus]